MLLSFKKYGVFLVLLMGLLLVGCQNISSKDDAALPVDEVKQQVLHKTNCIKIGQIAYRAYETRKFNKGNVQVFIGISVKPYAHAFVNMYASNYGNTLPLEDHLSEHDFIAQCITQQDEVEEILSNYTQDMESEIGFMANVLEFTNACYWPQAYAEQLESIKQNIAKLKWAVGFEDVLLKQYEKVLDTVIASPEKIREEQLVINMPLIQIIFERIMPDELDERLKDREVEGKE